MKFKYLLLLPLFALPVSLLASPSEPKQHELVENINQLISANKQSIQPVFDAYRYQLDKILEFNGLEEKADDVYFLPNIRKTSIQLVFKNLYDLIINIDSKLPYHDKLFMFMSSQKELSNYFDINIKPSLLLLLSNSTQTDYLSELTDEIKEFKNLKRIKIKLPTQKTKLTTMNRNIEYPIILNSGSSQQEKPEGTVELLFIVSEAGRVIWTKVVSETDELLNDAAIEGVKSWVFNPAIKDGLLVRTRSKTRVDFKR